MYSQPWYRNYPAYGTYSLYQPSPLYYDAASEERRRALAERQRRRAQWLPDEMFDNDDNDYDDLNPWDYQLRKQETLQRQKALEAQKRLEEQQKLEALRRMEEQRHREELRRQEELRQAELRRKVLDEEARRLEQLKRAQSPQRAFPPRFTPAGPREDSSLPIPIRVRQPSPQPRRTSSSLSSKLSGISAEASQPNPRTPTTLSSPSPAQPVKLRTAHTVEEQNAAASRIQQQYRIHTSFRTLSQYESQFEALRKGFVYPAKIDFQKPGSEDGVITASAYRPPSDFEKEPEEVGGAPMEVDGAEGKLAYTSTNYPLHTYTDAMDKLLMKLDGVESWGQKAIRERRRGIVKNIEKESSKVDRYWKQAWADHLETQSVKPASVPTVANEASPDSDEQTMDIDEQPEHQQPDERLVDEQPVAEQSTVEQTANTQSPSQIQGETQTSSQAVTFRVHEGPIESS